MNLLFVAEYFLFMIFSCLFLNILNAPFTYLMSLLVLLFAAALAEFLLGSSRHEFPAKIRSDQKSHGFGHRLFCLFPVIPV